MDELINKDEQINNKPGQEDNSTAKENSNKISSLTSQSSMDEVVNM